MNRRTASLTAVILTMFLVVLSNVGGLAQEEPMGFFITSVGPGDGANLGGLEGADQHCQTLAAGAGSRTWRAYLSTVAGGGQPPVNARDRIGDGPWYNANGTLIAWNVADLHGDVERDRNNIRKPTALDENGEPVNGVGDQPNQHDILTGSDSHGRALLAARPQASESSWRLSQRMPPAPPATVDFVRAPWRAGRPRVAPPRWRRAELRLADSRKAARAAEYRPAQRRWLNRCGLR